MMFYVAVQPDTEVCLKHYKEGGCTMQFMEKLFELRKVSGLSQEEVADKLGVSRQTVSKWESGQSSPEMDKLPAISELFHVSVDYLLKPSDIDALSIKTAQLEQQQKEMEKEIKKKNAISFLIISIVVGLLFFFAGVLLTRNLMVDISNPVARTGITPALLLLIAGVVVLANYIHSRKNK